MRHVSGVCEVAVVFKIIDGLELRGSSRYIYILHAAEILCHLDYQSTTICHELREQTVDMKKRWS